MFASNTSHFYVKPKNQPLRTLAPRIHTPNLSLGTNRQYVKELEVGDIVLTVPHFERCQVASFVLDKCFQPPHTPQWVLELEAEDSEEYFSDTEEVHAEEWKLKACDPNIIVIRYLDRKHHPKLCIDTVNFRTVLTSHIRKD